MTNISNEAELRACKDDATADYTVTADIVLTGAFTSYQIYAYTGTFDGGDYTISNLTIAYNTIYSGLFRYNNTGTIQNVKLSNVACSCTDATTYKGALCGYNKGTINNCYILSGTCSWTAQKCGGLTGWNVGTITNSSNAANVTSTQSIQGGITGMGGGTITGCVNSGSVKRSTAGNAYVGGIIGYENIALTISNCSNSGTIGQSNNAGVGGIIGYDSSTVTMSDCSNSGTIYGVGDTRGTGGIIGDMTAGTVTDCTNTGRVAGYTQHAGGIIGILYGGSMSGCINNGGYVTCTGTRCGGVGGSLYGSGTVSNCSSSGAVSSKGWCGGFVGGTTGAGRVIIENCYATGNVTMATSSTVDYAGGFAGCVYDGKTIRKCYSTGNVTGIALRKCNGGFVGYNYGTIDNCYATGNIAGSGSQYYACFVGDNRGTIRRCYATGNMTSTVPNRCAGFVGLNCYNTHKIYNCFCTGTVASNTYNGMFCSTYTSGISNCGCRDHATIRDIGSPVGDVTYAKADPTEWYDKTENVYDTGTYTWDFATPVWYEWSNDYPKFIEDPTLATTSNATFFGCNFIILNNLDI